MVGKQEDILQDTAFMLGKPKFTLRDKLFQHKVSLIDDETNSAYNMLTENDINTILDVLSMSFKNIEDIEGRIDKRRTKMSLANTNRLKVLKSFHIHNGRIGTPFSVADWLDLEKNIFEELRLSYQEIDYNIDASQSVSTQPYSGQSNAPSKYSPVE